MKYKNHYVLRLRTCLEVGFSLKESLSSERTKYGFFCPLVNCGGCVTDACKLISEWPCDGVMSLRNCSGGLRQDLWDDSNWILHEEGKCHLAFIVKCYFNTRQWNGQTLLTLLFPCPLLPEGLLLFKGKKKLHEFTPADLDFFLALPSSIFKCYLFLSA